MTTRDELVDPVVPTAPGIVPEASPSAAGSRWPFGILVVAALRLVDAAGLIIVGLDAGLLPFRGFPVLGNPDVTRALEVTFAILTVIGVIGLLARKGWGWVLTMALVGLGLLGEVIRYSLGVPDPAGLLILVVSAFYLNQRQVRAVARDMLEDDR